jgi:hypothetical protein
MTLSRFALYLHTWQRETCVTMRLAFLRRLEFHWYVIPALLIHGRACLLVHVTSQLLDTVMGLDYLHGLGVVHTDLKGVRLQWPTISSGS